MIDNELPELDALLNESAPPASPHGPERIAALEVMARDARPTRRRARRPLAIGAAALVLALAGGAAAATAFDWPVPWAVASYAYTLPSGARCEISVITMDGPPEQVAAAKAFLARKDLLDVIDVDAALASLEAEPNTHLLADGTEVDAGPGTKYWFGADVAYQLAFDQAVSDALAADLAARGFGDSAMESRATLNCPDIQLPDWMKTAGE